MTELSDKMIRLIAVEVAARLHQPNDVLGNLLIRANEIYRYIHSGREPELNLEAES